MTAALVAVVALNVDQTDADPKGAFALIFGIIGVFVVLLFLFQSRDLRAAEAADAQAGGAPRATVENPATLDEPSLWAAMAIRPIDADALRARKEIWGTARGSIRLGMLICALIFLAVPPIYLLDTFVPLMIGAPLIAGIALWKSVARCSAAGGDLDQAYDAADRAMAPLGLAATERPEIRIEPKSVAPFRMGPGMHGAVVLEGERHGRAVSVRMPADEGVRSKCQIRVGRSRRPSSSSARATGASRPEDGAPRGRGRRAEGGAELDALERRAREAAAPTGSPSSARASGSGDWLLDLWLAERLADAVGASADQSGSSQATQ